MPIYRSLSKALSRLSVSPTLTLEYQRTDCHAFYLLKACNIFFFFFFENFTRFVLCVSSCVRFESSYYSNCIESILGFRVVWFLQESTISFDNALSILVGKPSVRNFSSNAVTIDNAVASAMQLSALITGDVTVSRYFQRKVHVIVHSCVRFSVFNVPAFSSFLSVRPYLARVHVNSW